MNAGAQVSRTLPHGIVPPTSRVGLSTWIYLIYIIAQDTLRFVFGILGPVKLRTTVNYHNP